jgi:LmbE family N-acetylglucosaminyl deacetylase
MHIVIVGAHPDDAESNAGGAAALFRARGDNVRMITVTDGRLGHYDPRYAREPRALAARRMAESREAADVIGAEVVSLGVPQGDAVSPDALLALVRELRAFGSSPGIGPDLVITHRPLDHPRDHRNTAEAVVEACSLAASPLYDPDTALRADTGGAPHVPPIAYWQDDYAEVSPFRADTVIAIDDVIGIKTRMLAAHASQVFEYLPWNAGTTADVPADPAERLAWLARTRVEPMAVHVRAACAESLHAQLPHGRFAEAFQLSEYGRQVDPETLFPMNGATGILLDTPDA